jgi:hypothetical protein
LQPGPPLVIECPRREPSPKLEVPPVENAVAMSSPGGSRPGPQSQNLVHHDGCGLPLAWGDAGVQVSEPRFEKGLTHIGPHPPASLNAGTGSLAHICCPFFWGAGAVGRAPRGLGSMPESLRRVEPSGSPSGRAELPRNSKCSWRSSRVPVIIPAIDRSWCTRSVMLRSKVSTGIHTPGFRPGYNLAYCDRSLASRPRGWVIRWGR